MSKNVDLGNPITIKSDDSKEICKINAEYFKLESKKRMMFLTTMYNWVSDEMSKL
tara:strand:+ start:1557 stop:1721 length:165 start_codon:yes stop_codon:yes gene_type:complete